MVVITEIPDGSNGGDPNKKPEEDKHKEKPEEEEEEEDDQNENPQEKQEVQEAQNLPTSFAQMASELTEHIVAILRRCHYPNLSLTSRAFNRLLHTPELYENRLSRGVAEVVLYTFIRLFDMDSPRLYILHRGDNITPQLRLIDMHHPIPSGSAVVTIGAEIYVIGGSVGYDQYTSSVMIIDCRFHTLHFLPSMRRARYRAAAGVIDGKIYVIGGCETPTSDTEWIEVFDLRTRVWGSVLCCPYLLNAGWRSTFLTYTVMETKLYVLNGMSCFTYEPRERRWGRLSDVGELAGYWRKPSCLVGDLLCSIDVLRRHGSRIIVYDPEEKIWRAVRGLDHGLPNDLFYYESKMANVGGNLVILACNQSQMWWDHSRNAEIWCVEIALETRQGGQIWGNVVSINRVLTTTYMPSIELCPTVTV